MSILVVGSVGLDDVQTPSGSRTRTLGGACVYFATAASLYQRVAVVGIVGEDFPQEHVDFLETRNIDLRGLQVTEGKTFFWAGCYGEALDDAVTLDTQLNVFADFHPVVPDDLRDSEYVFLANIDPDLQIEVLEQMRRPRLTALDSMNFWITSKRRALTRALSMVDVVLLNETEVKMYAEDQNLLRAARHILSLGPKALVIKQGAMGSFLVTAGSDPAYASFVCRAFPVENVVDPTGAGDSFAAGLVGYLARQGDLKIETLRRAVVHGNIVGSFTIEDFSIDRLRPLTIKDIEARYETYRCLTHFDALSGEGCVPFGRNIV